MLRPSAPVVIAVFRIRTDFNKSAFFTPVPVFSIYRIRLRVFTLLARD